MHIVTRLYENFHPDHYSLRLTLDRAARRFEGRVVIRGESLLPGSLRLHAKDLTIDRAKVNGNEATVELLADDVVALSNDNLQVGAVEVELTFGGIITDAMHGLYPCYYEHDGQKKELLATQFESHHAREVFPCVDEPEAKATFDVELVTEPGVTVLGNMPSVSQSTDANGQLVTRFDTTPRMSSYLLAFVVGELQKKTAHTKDGVEVSTWATLAQPAESLDFGLDVAVRSIEFFNDYFGIAYPLPKADHVAIPDFSSGAMENWGLITYREICLLADATSAISSREYIATVIAHETSHQWFGNLVTMRWWDDLWLNESFATIMEYVCVDALFPEWDIWMNFATQDILSALRRDHLPGVQAVKTPVTHPDEISTLFDPSIVYAKGARTLAMCRAYVGDEAFRNGLRDYFETHQYTNTTGDDLWAALSRASDKDVGNFMTPWIETPGLPRVHATASDGSLTLTQTPFIIPAPEKPVDQTWPILLGSNDEAIPELLTEESLTVTPTLDPLHLNQGAVTHAVFHYDAALMSDLIARAETLAPIDRLSLLHDISLLAKAGHSHADQLFEAIAAFRIETSQPVWDIMALGIADLRRLVEDNDEAEAALKQSIVRLATPLYRKLGWVPQAGEAESDTKLRATLAALLGYADETDVIEHALVDFRSAADLQSLAGELRPTIFALTAKHGEATDIERMIEVHRTTTASELKNDLAAGLTSTRDAALIERLLDQLTDKESVRQQDVGRWFAWLMQNRYAREATWKWLEENWDWIVATFGGDKSYDDYVRYSASALGTEAWLARYRAFFADKRSIPALARAIELGEADIKVRADWHDRDAADFATFLTRRSRTARS